VLAAWCGTSALRAKTGGRRHGATAIESTPHRGPRRPARAGNGRWSGPASAPPVFRAPPFGPVPGSSRQAPCVRRRPRTGA
jgi:hypothetical protein